MKQYFTTLLPNMNMLLLMPLTEIASLYLYCLESLKKSGHAMWPSRISTAPYPGSLTTLTPWAMFAIDLVRVIAYITLLMFDR